MEHKEIQKIVIILILELLHDLGLEKNVEINPDTCLIKDFEGFDSLQGVLLTAIIEEKLGLPKDKVLNFFVSENRRKALTIKEIVERIASQLK